MPKKKSRRGGGEGGAVAASVGNSFFQSCQCFGNVIKRHGCMPLFPMSPLTGETRLARAVSDLHVSTDQIGGRRGLLRRKILIEAPLSMCRAVREGGR